MTFKFTFNTYGSFSWIKHFPRLDFRKNVKKVWWGIHESVEAATLWFTPASCINYQTGIRNYPPSSSACKFPCFRFVFRFLFHSVKAQGMSGSFVIQLELSPSRAMRKSLLLPAPQANAQQLFDTTASDNGENDEKPTSDSGADVTSIFQDLLPGARRENLFFAGSSIKSNALFRCPRSRKGLSISTSIR